MLPRPWAASVDVPWRDNPDAHLQGAVGAWRTAFIRMPYNREQLTPRGIISDTFETATTWDAGSRNFYRRHQGGHPGRHPRRDRP